MINVQKRVICLYKKINLIFFMLLLMINKCFDFELRREKKSKFYFCLSINI